MRFVIVIFFLFFIGELRSQDSLQSDSTSTKAAMTKYFLQFGLHPDSATTVKLFEMVYEWKGTRYQHAGHSQKGVDCSGFANEIYKSCYDTCLLGGCTNIYTQVDTITKDSLREGDLVFFKIRKGQISHVGVYLGDSYFAHASVHSGVTVSSLNEDYYRRYYFTGGRLKK